MHTNTRTHIHNGVKTALIASIALIASAPLTAQSSIRPDQLKTTSNTATPPLLLARDGSAFQIVMLGPGLTLTKSTTGVWTVSAPAPAPVTPPKVNIVLVQFVLPREQDGTYPAPANAVIYRNGVRQRVDSDYKIVNGRIVFVIATAADDDITADSWRAEQ